MKFQIYKRWTWKGFRYFWRLKAKNGEIVASGEEYVRPGDCNHAIDLIRDAVDSPVEWL